MTQTLRLTAPLLSAMCLAWMVYYLVMNLRIRPKAGRALEDFYAFAGNTKRAASRSELIGNQITARLPFSLEAWEEHLKWAQRGGSFKDWGVGRLVFMAMLCSGFSMCVLLVKPSLACLLVSIGAAAYPFISVRAKANTVRKRVIRSLPELATLVAAEMSAGISPEQAIQRASTLPGMLAGLLSDGLVYARRAERPLFGRELIPGGLVEFCSQTGLPELISFAVQLDLVAEKGVAGALLMNEVAKTLSREYRSRLDSEIEKLNGRLMLATAVFFFIPFVLIILGSFIAPVMAIFR
jgi:Flp pilus assembly protein TadB